MTTDLSHGSQLWMELYRHIIPGPKNMFFMTFLYSKKTKLECIVKFGSLFYEAKTTSNTAVHFSPLLYTFVLLTWQPKPFQFHPRTVNRAPGHRASQGIPRSKAGIGHRVGASSQTKCSFKMFFQGRRQKKMKQTNKLCAVQLSLLPCQNAIEFLWLPFSEFWIPKLFWILDPKVMLVIIVL